MKIGNFRKQTQGLSKAISASFPDFYVVLQIANVSHFLDSYHFALLSSEKVMKNSKQIAH